MNAEATTTTNRLHVTPQVGFARPLSVWERFEPRHDFLVVQFGPLPEPPRQPLHCFHHGDLP